MGVKMNLSMITKNHATDQEKGFLTKSILKPFGRTTLELNKFKHVLNFMI